MLKKYEACICTMPVLSIPNNALPEHHPINHVAMVTETYITGASFNCYKTEIGRQAMGMELTQNQKQ